MILIALDPGVITGYITADTTDGELLKTHYHAGIIEYGQVHKEAIWEVLREIDQKAYEFSDHLTIIHESFEYRRHKTHANLEPVKVIGIIEEFARQHNATIYTQTASQGKISSGSAYFNEVRLKKLGLWFTGHVHARDAAGHYLYWKYFGAGKRPGVRPPC